MLNSMEHGIPGAHKNYNTEISGCFFLGGDLLLVSCVPMREQEKNDKKCTFFWAVHCATFKSIRRGKTICLLEQGKLCFLQIC